MQDSVARHSESRVTYQRRIRNHGTSNLPVTLNFPRACRFFQTRIAWSSPSTSSKICIIIMYIEIFLSPVFQISCFTI